MKNNMYRIDGDSVRCKGQNIPVVWNGDVLVSGGGPGGIGAAISSSRNGRSTMLVEKYGFLGGMCSYGSGMPLGGAYPAHRTIGGIAEEILSAVANAGPEAASVRDVKHFSFWYFHDSEYFKHLAFRFVEEAGVELLLHTMVVDVILDNENEKRILGVITESKSGRQALLAKSFVDATGDGDVVARAGAEYRKGEDEAGSMMHVTIPYILSDVNVKAFTEFHETDPGFKNTIEKARADGLPVHEDDKFTSWHIGMRPDTIFSNIVRVANVDGTDVNSMTKAEVECRRRIYQQLDFFRKYVPGCDKAYVSCSGAQIGIRDTRRIVGEYTLTVDECLALKKQPDQVILRCGGPIDSVARGKISGYVKPMPDEDDWFDIPYGCIVPKGLDNLLVAGREFSADPLAQAGSRGMALLMGMGHAAGSAAHLSLEQNICMRDVNIKDLQALLVSQGMDLGLEPEDDSSHSG